MHENPVHRRECRHQGLRHQGILEARRIDPEPDRRHGVLNGRRDRARAPCGQDQGSALGEGGLRRAARTAARPGKSKLDPFRPEIETLLASGSTKKFAARRYKTAPDHPANWMKKNGIRKPKA
ncbi:MAG: hypothetical protein F4213_02630 [Boseongicola sp. SB0677_bin_26]|nr:hypothetical protein [Boseongicola sp. SB0665_bin_10]MYG24912.1 hypothetical protein [Boseongicola sp. SB0677_bin_26]